MSSHGVPRLTENRPRTAEEREKELQQIGNYQTLVRKVNERVQAREFTSETLALVTQLLTKNPEYYTVWNHRRRILKASLSLNELTVTEKEIIGDLRFLVPLLIKFPKCYWIWKYRLWLLEQTSLLLPAENARSIWEGELDLVSKLLSRDGRNFHGWGYRRKIVSGLETKFPMTDMQTCSLVKMELDYTTKMINLNLSNFSAWHNRSKLIPCYLQELRANDAQRQAILDEEITLIHNALIDPYDQSLWFYHACLMTTMTSRQVKNSLAPSLSQPRRLEYLKDEVSFILEILEETKDCKWIYLSLLQLVLDYRDQAGKWPENGDEGKILLWMQQLQTLDPLRMGRWEVLKHRLGI